MKSYRIKSNHIKSYQIISNHIKSYQIISKHIKTYQIISNHIKSYQIISNHISNHIIIKSYQIISNLSNHGVCLLPHHIFGINRHSNWGHSPRTESCPVPQCVNPDWLNCLDFGRSPVMDILALTDPLDWLSPGTLEYRLFLLPVLNGCVVMVASGDWMVRRWLTSLPQSICPRLEAVVDTWHQVWRSHQAHDLICGGVIRMTWRSYVGQWPYPWFWSRAAPF